jgi:glycosyltransferase involved in cell wall biosynthesis
MLPISSATAVTAAALPATTAVVWHAPVGCDFSGFFMESLTFAVGLSSLLQNFHFDVGQCTSHMLSQLSSVERDVLVQSQSTPQTSPGVLILHKLPQQNYHISTTQYPPHLLIGRQMTETTKLPLSEAKQAMRMDEVWVPTAFHRTIFTQSGVDPDRIFVMPEPMDTTFFQRLDTDAKDLKDNDFTRFLSIFKWEERKGWDILLTSYWTAFEQHDNVELALRTYKPSWLSGEKSIQILLETYASEHFGKSLNELAKVVLYPSDLSKEQLRALYASSNAFVLPTRGEGWCLPCVEAMSMQLPIVVTNFSGPTEYMTTKNAYPISFTMKENGFAEPDVTEVMTALKSIVVNPLQAVSKGAAARHDVVTRFAVEVVAQKVVDRLSVLWHEKKNEDDL